MIQVTKTFLPPKFEYENIIENIWNTNQIANGGKLHSKLTFRLKNFLAVQNVILTANGTLPLQIALKSMGKQGEVITTPFSYVATCSSIVWENCKPVFVDIDPDHLTIDENKIEEKITNDTTAILATHVFGNPCNIEVIQQIAKKYELKIIYDAAHCFGVKYKGYSIFNYGDVSTCSFHATKIFHTGEGGAIFCKDAELYQELFNKHNFGHEGKLKIKELGINAKMNELQAGMGLSVLPYFVRIRKANKKVVNWYDGTLDFSVLKRPLLRSNTEWNFGYYPIIFPDEKVLLKIERKLNEEGIFPRRYFYPSLNTLEYVQYVDMPISEDISKRILCLPIFSELKEKEVLLISSIINNYL